MKKNIINKRVAGNIINRAAALQVTSTCKWGSMQVTEMLHHCNTVNSMILEGKADNRQGTIRQGVLKFLFLYIIPKFPKNVKAPSAVEKSVVAADRFDVEKAKFTETIMRFTDSERALEARHPYFGKLSTTEWGLFTWMHMDHHLRQFGV